MDIKTVCTRYRYGISLGNVGLCFLVLCLTSGCYRHGPVSAKQGKFDIVGNRIVSSTVFQGNVFFDHSIYIPKGKTLTIKAGSRVIFSPKHSNRLSFPFIGKKLQIMVAGQLLIEGKEGTEVTLSSMDKKWQGIVILPGGKAEINHARLNNVISGLTCLRGEYHIRNAKITNFEYGIYTFRSIQTCNKLILENGTFGIYTDNKDIRPYQFYKVRHPIWLYSSASASEPAPPVTHTNAAPHWHIQYRGKIDINKDQVWDGDILVRSRIRVAKGVTLRIMPGSRVFFEDFDSNGDGLGDAEIMVVGRIIAVGSPDKKIVFRSLEPLKRWAGIRIIDSDIKDNLFEHVEIRNAKRGIHGHFASVLIKNSRFENNVSNLEFQDSDFHVENSEFSNSITGIRFRNSHLYFTNNRVNNGLNGIECSQSRVEILSCIFESKSNFALKARNSELVIDKNVFRNNRKGMLFHQSVVKITDNKIINHAESGVYISNSQVYFAGNISENNNFDGLTLKKTKIKLLSNNFFFNQHNGISTNESNLEKSNNSFKGNAKQDIFYQN